MDIIKRLTELKLYQLLFGGIAASILFTETIVALLSILFRGRITYDYLITGAIAALIVSFVVVYILTSLLTERKKAEDKTIKAEAKFHALFDSISDAVFINDMEGHFLEVNHSACERLGYSHEELLQMCPTDIDTREYAAKVPERIKALLEQGRLVFESAYVRRDGVVIPIELSDRVIEYDGKPAIVGVARDISDRKKAEDRLRESEKTIKAIMNATSDAILLIDAVGNILALNETTALRIGKTKGELIGTCIYDYLPPDIARSRRAYVNEAVRTGKTVSFEDKRNGEWIDHSIYPIFDEQEKIVGVTIYGRYVTERKKAEDKLENAYQETKAAQHASLNIMEDLERERRRLDASLRERELLLQEVHHRVKNNLQVIISMIRLQARLVGDEKTLGLLKETQSRIEAVALVHEKLYRFKDLAKIGFKDYIQSLAQYLIQTYSVSSGRIALKVDAEAVNINMDKSIPLGLIINELITNSIKYAFPEGRAGKIAIILRQVSDREVELVVSDNGIGIPGELDIRNTKSFGMQLVIVLAEDQLKGSIGINRDNGTEFRIRCKI